MGRGRSHGPRCLSGRAGPAQRPTGPVLWSRPSRAGAGVTASAPRAPTSRSQAPRPAVPSTACQSSRACAAAPSRSLLDRVAVRPRGDPRQPAPPWRTRTATPPLHPPPPRQSLQCRALRAATWNQNGLRGALRKHKISVSTRFSAAAASARGNRTLLPVGVGVPETPWPPGDAGRGPLAASLGPCGPCAWVGPHVRAGCCERPAGQRTARGSSGVGTAGGGVEDRLRVKSPWGGRP